MIEESATVVGVDEAYAYVETECRAACGSCQSKAGCGTSLLAGLFKRRRNRIRVLNPIQARTGEQVIIGLPETAFLKASAAAYLLPLLGMLGFAVVGQVMARRFMLPGGELLSIAGGLLGFVIGLFLFKRQVQRQSEDPACQATILRQANSRPVSIV